jgi:hypothetical protein
MELRYQGSNNQQLFTFHGFSNADWSGDFNTSRLTSGYAFICNGSTICWNSKRQSMVALSSTKSKYIGLSNAGQHLAWLRTFFDKIGHCQKHATDLYSGSAACVCAPAEMAQQYESSAQQGDKGETSGKENKLCQARTNEGLGRILRTLLRHLDY